MALGLKDSRLSACFVIFVAVLSEIGAGLGLVGGNFLSGVLIRANVNTYSVAGLVKDVSLSSLFIDLVTSTAVFCLTAFFCYFFVGGKEPGTLIAGNENCVVFSLSLRAANSLCSMIPTKNKFPLRIALHKPLSIFLIIVAVMSFSVCMILGRSLNKAAKKFMTQQQAKPDRSSGTKGLHSPYIDNNGDASYEPGEGVMEFNSE